MRNLKKYILFLLTVLMLISSTGCASTMIGFKKNYKIKSGRDITFYVATDVHYLANNLTDHRAAFQKYVSSGDGKQLGYIDDILNAFVYDVKRTKPDVLIISGDLTNNGEKESHLDLAKKLKQIKDAGTSIYVIPGNHDISNPWARGFKGDKQYVTDNISARDFSKIYADFGYDEAISKDKDTLSYLATPSADVWLLMLDTNKYKDNFTLGMPEADGELSKNTLNWIKKCGALAKKKGATIITVMHHNILNHSDVIQKGYTLNNNKEALKIFEDNNFNLVLSGHIHVQDISSYNKEGKTLYDVVTNALVVCPHQYGMLKYSAKGRSFDYSTSRVDVEGWSKDKKITDTNLNNFKKYSADYFGKFAYDMAFNQLIDDESYTLDEVKSMSETMRILNLRYFAGTENLNSKDVMGSEGYKLLIASPDGFLKRYAESISSDKDTDDNSLHFKINSTSK